MSLLTIQLISGQHLPNVSSKQAGDIIEPYVKIRIHGHPCDTDEWTSAVVPKNGFNPQWDETAAETYGVWGPFLVITPASTLHNWQQEIARFVPDFKCVPYWGNPGERKVLRGFWNQENLHTKKSSFHIVVTSYQIVVTDYKYFTRQSWMYMVLDEAQAITTTATMDFSLQY